MKLNSETRLRQKENYENFNQKKTVFLKLGFEAFEIIAKLLPTGFSLIVVDNNEVNQPLYNQVEFNEKKQINIENSKIEISKKEKEAKKIKLNPKFKQTLKFICETLSISRFSNLLINFGNSEMCENLYFLENKSVVDLRFIENQISKNKFNCIEEFENEVRVLFEESLAMNSKNEKVLNGLQEIGELYNRTLEVKKNELFHIFSVPKKSEPSYKEIKENIKKEENYSIEKNLIPQKFIAENICNSNKKINKFDADFKKIKDFPSEEFILEKIKNY